MFLCTAETLLLGGLHECRLHAAGIHKHRDGRGIRVRRPASSESSASHGSSAAGPLAASSSWTAVAAPVSPDDTTTHSIIDRSTDPRRPDGISHAGPQNPYGGTKGRHSTSCAIEGCCTFTAAPAAAAAAPCCQWLEQHTGSCSGMSVHVAANTARCSVAGVRSDVW